jgi:ABC-2 type transport system ATP-binding protein
MAVIELSGLTKEYGDVRANDDVTFTVEEGEIFGYLGPNGAGKTTTIRTLIGLQAPTSGTATVLGADIRDESALASARQRVGYLPSNPQFDEHVTGTEMLDLHASIKDDPRRDELLELFDPPLTRPIRGYSTGQRQQLGIVLTFMHDPDLVVMDEPTGGLDPLVQQRFNEFIREESRSGTTVFLSSHILSEVRRVCDRVAVIRAGRIVTVDGVEELLHRAGKFVRLRLTGGLSAQDVTLDGIHDLSVRSVDGAYSASTVDGTEHDDVTTATELSFSYTGDFDSLIAFLDGREILELDVEEAPLEQVFMQFYDDSEATVEEAA